MLGEGPPDRNLDDGQTDVNRFKVHIADDAHLSQVEFLIVKRDFGFTKTR